MIYDDDDGSLKKSPAKFHDPRLQAAFDSYHHVFVNARLLSALQLCEIWFAKHAAPGTADAEIAEIKEAIAFARGEK